MSDLASTAVVVASAVPMSKNNKGTGRRKVKVRTADVASPLTSDIDLTTRFNAIETDKTVNRCISALIEALKTESKHFTDEQRNHLSHIFFSIRHAHRAVRKFLQSEESDPAVVNAM